MKKVIVVYDDSLMPQKEVKSITGSKSFGDTIFKRITLKNRIKETVMEEKAVIKFLEYRHQDDFDRIQNEFMQVEENVAVLHLYSNYSLADINAFQVILTKAEYINENYAVLCDEKPAMFLVNGIEEYKKVFSALLNRSFEAQALETNAFMDLSLLPVFLNFITGGFDARFFNALDGDDYTVTKKSTKIDKIKSEFNFYYLLPDHMKMWFVMPFDYKESEDGASYTMERFHMTDIAIRFVHGAVGLEECSDILDKLFYFIHSRQRKAASAEVLKRTADQLYVQKLKTRMEELKGYQQYEQFNQLLNMGTIYQNLDEIVERYLRLYDNSKRNEKETYLVIGHGDLCFSNILYSKEANLLKLIDPKGALEEDELYTDPYYDLAKLSHSICGCYDFFNNGLYQINTDRDLQVTLTIDMNPKPYADIFKHYLQKYDFDYKLVRLYEASLFLSMLPYHMDQPGKVFGFILNAIRILDEIEGECK